MWLSVGDFFYLSWLVVILHKRFLTSCSAVSLPNDSFVISMFILLSDR